MLTERATPLGKSKGRRVKHFLYETPMADRSSFVSEFIPASSACGE
jgi:hypothetical protein